VSDPEFDKIWRPVQSVIDHLKMGYDESVIIGGAFGQLIAEVKQLKADNAALIECVKEVARQSNNHDTTTLKMLARECLAKLGGGGD
jgi:hypothetical protein